MKVIKKGTGQKGWSKECVCTGAGNGEGGCKATLRVEQSDLYKTHHHDYGGGHDIFITFKCCECGVETDINGVPGHIIDNLPDKPTGRGPWD